MTTLMQRMREDLVRRNYAESTIRSYLHTLEDFRRYAQRRLDHPGTDDIRRYQVYLREERKLDIGTASNYVAALRFFYVKMSAEIFPAHQGLAQKVSAQVSRFPCRCIPKAKVIVLGQLGALGEPDCLRPSVPPTER